MCRRLFGLYRRAVIFCVYVFVCSHLFLVSFRSTQRFFCVVRQALILIQFWSTVNNSFCVLYYSWALFFGFSFVPINFSAKSPNSSFALQSSLILLAGLSCLYQSIFLKTSSIWHRFLRVNSLLTVTTDPIQDEDEGMCRWVYLKSTLQTGHCYWKPVLGRRWW